MTVPLDWRGQPVVGIYHPQHDAVARIVSTVVPADRLRVCASADLPAGFLAGVDVLLAKRFKGHQFPRRDILSADTLQWLHLGSAGIDYILPLDSRPLVTTSRGLHGPTTAEYVFAVVLEWQRRLPALREAQQARRWTRPPLAATLHGQTMGILGLGHVGTSVAERAAAFGMRTIGTRYSGRPIPGVEEVYGPEGTARVLEAADVVVVTLPLTDRTRGLIDRHMLGRIKPGAFLVVVSRGGIVDEGALLEAMRDGRCAGAAIDVFEREPLPEDSPLWSAPNLLVTPHVSGALSDPAVAEAHLFLDNLDRWMRAQPLRNVVDPALGY